MAQRILTLTVYLARRLLLSLAGLIFILATLAVWRLFFDPGQSTPEPAYYVLVIGLFGGGAAFLVTLSAAARGYRAVNYPLLARLPSRVEHLTAVFLSSLTFTLFLQLLLAILATFNGPSLSLSRLLEIPPLWLATDILAIVLALHASDMVTKGWSRVYVYGILGIFLFGRELDATLGDWFYERLLAISGWLFQQGLATVGNVINSAARWFADSGSGTVGRVFDILFWPFQAIIDAVVAGSFTPVQALAPAILILYATFLFLIAAELFATKDIFLTE